MHTPSLQRVLASLSAASILFAAACSGGPAAPATMDGAIAALMARPELPDTAITVQHVLIAFEGKVPGVTRSQPQAKELAEKVWAEATGGADFKALMKQHSNDPGPGEYPMTKQGRQQMVAGFGDVGFRLAVGQIGVAPFDAKTSPYGWHIIKRVK